MPKPVMEAGERPDESARSLAMSLRRTAGHASTDLSGSLCGPCPGQNLAAAHFWTYRTIPSPMAPATTVTAAICGQSSGKWLAEAMKKSIGNERVTFAREAQRALRPQLGSGAAPEVNAPTIPPP